MSAEVTPFRSVLFQEPEPADGEAPPYFGDLHLDQIVDSITAGRDEYDLGRFFSACLHSTDAIAYRHEVFRDLERDGLSAHVRSFADAMRTVREQLRRMQKLRYPRQQESLFLDAMGTYCDAVAALAGDLARVDVRSRGFLAFRDYVEGYVQSQEFRTLQADTTDVKERLSEVTYSVHIDGSRVTVRPYEDEADYSREVEDTFARFRQGAVRSYLVRIPDYLDMTHVEAAVLDRVAQLHPDPFETLTDYCKRHREWLDDTIRRFDREVQFYLAYLEHVKRFETAGLPFCYPDVSEESKVVAASETFDLALAGKLRGEGSAVVRNDFHLDEPERIFVVSGPNQGGKTTFARTFGQLHHLASLGCPVPGRRARLFLCDALFTHFEKEEDIGDLTGKLQSDLERIRGLLEQATSQSIVILNESFSATTLDDARFLGTKILEEIIERDVLCVCVTFVDELASLSDTTVSMVSAIVPGNPAQRTFKIERRPADGLAYAAVIAEKYGLTYEALKDRIAS